jgi:LysR family transcriptional regulator, glycine cleavage system transcriptional activator
MRRIPLATLPAFRAAARHQNLRAAADQLSLTPSAVSQQIRLLEEQLGFELFERKGRSLRLNAAGTRFLQSVQAGLDELDAGMAAAHRSATERRELVRVSMLPSLAQRWLLPRLVRWQQRHPHLTLDLQTSQSLVDLKRERFHAAVRVGLGPWRGLHCERIMDCPAIAVAAPARARQFSYGDHAAIAAQPLLGATEKWRKFLAQCGCSLEGRTVAEFNDAGLMVQAAEHDLGIALVREVLARDALKAGQLVRVSPHEYAIDDELGYWFVTLPELVDWHPVQAFRAWLLEETEAPQVVGGAASEPPISGPAAAPNPRRPQTAKPSAAGKRRSTSRRGKPAA